MRKECKELESEVWPRMFREGASLADMLALECEVCKSERQARARVVFLDDDARFQEWPFDEAQYIHPNNLPKYVALQLWALVYAGQRQLCVNWWWLMTSLCTKRTSRCRKKL